MDYSEKLYRELEAIRSSRSWRVTRLPRRVSHHAKRVLHKNKRSQSGPSGDQKNSKAPLLSRSLSDAELNRIMHITAKAELAMHENNLLEAERLWTSFLERYGRKTPSSAYIRLSIVYRKKGEYSQALKVIKAGSARHPNYLPFRIECAEIAMGLGEWKKAVTEWRAVIRNSDSVNANAWLKLSRAYRFLKEFDKSDNTLQKGLKSFPDDKQLLAEFALLAEARGDKRAALERWKPLLKDIETTDDIGTWQRLKDGRAYTSIAKRLINLKAYKKRIEEYQAVKSKRRTGSAKPRIAIYTAIVGDYDYLKLPEEISDDIDYILFTDQTTVDTGVFEVRPLPYFDADKTRSARYVKTHPHILLPDYDIVFWLDASIMIVDDILPIIQGFIDSGKPVGAIHHPVRKSIFDEARACIQLGKETREDIETQMQHYRMMQFDCNDLIESGFMGFDLRVPDVSLFLNTWWSEIDKFTKRDQLSVNYALDRANLLWHALLPKELCVRNHAAFVLTNHGSTNSIMNELTQALGGQPVDPMKQNVTKAATKTKSVDVIVCVHNALDDVTKCLESVELYKDKRMQLIVVDDGSDQQTADYLKQFCKTRSWTRLHRNKQAGGYTKAANAGLRLSSADLVILLNSDTVVTKNWVSKMDLALAATPGAGIVGPLSSAASHQSIPQHLSSKDQTAINVLPQGVSIDEMNSYCEKWSLKIFPRVPLAHGFCLGISRPVISTVGYFDEDSFPSGYGEENDYCFRAIDAGFGIVIATDTYIFHSKSKSYDSAKRIKLMKSGSETLARLHGKPRIHRSITTMQHNPLLERMREAAEKLYR